MATLLPANFWIFHASTIPPAATQPTVTQPAATQLTAGGGTNPVTIPFLNRITQMFNLFVNAPHPTLNQWLFIETFVIPLMKQVFTAGDIRDDDIPEDQVLRARAFNIIQNLRVELINRTGIDNSSCRQSCYVQTVFFAQVEIDAINAENAANSNGRPREVPQSRAQIIFNSDWIQRAESNMDYFGADLDRAIRTELNAHLVVGLDKLLHAFCHVLTYGMLDFEQEIKQQLVNNAAAADGGGGIVDRFNNTPVAIGVKIVRNGNKKSKKRKFSPSKQTREVYGDMGYAFQQLLMGNNLRLKLRKPTKNLWKSGGVYFEQGTVENAVTKFGNAKDYAVIRAFTFTETKDELDYIQNILIGFNNYYASPTDATALNWLHSFQVDFTLLSQDTSFSERIAISDKSKTRKNAADINLLSLFNEDAAEYSSYEDGLLEYPVLVIGGVTKKA